MNDLSHSEKIKVVNDKCYEMKTDNSCQKNGKKELEVEINWNNQLESKRVGLGFMVKNNYVVVSKCEPLSYAEDIFEVGDKILSINGETIKGKEDARNVVIKHLKEEGCVKFKIERDLDDIKKYKDEETNEVKQQVSSVKSFQLNSDCQRICGEAIKMIKQKPKPLKGQLIDNHKASHLYDYSDVVKFDDEVIEKLISCDTEGRKLKKVAPRDKK
ncbi:PDZ domain-containing protein [Strongyloides ratti]|uniref:PDZ domain-containing protein n=1 Tax=Strongyloides ratti TaxID=34506 RepID=A0A090LGA9_STRRB|nr:PDZ domain-containing protein [Strongyloides ratti]CEF68787.1 PDZ domain-containing protein [Strongyloides ratti]